MFFRELWYCFTDDESGPFPLRVIIRKYAEGELQKGDLVRKASSPDWEAIESVRTIVLGAARYRRRARSRTGWSAIERRFHALMMSTSGAITRRGTRLLLAIVILLGLIVFIGYSIPQGIKK